MYPHKFLQVNEKVITTTLPNGLRVVSVDSTSAVAQVGVFIKSGSRNEDSHNQGTTHFLEKMAFKSTKNRTDARFVRDMSRIAANIYCTSTRDSLVYGASVLRDFVPEALGAIADVIQHPSFESHEMAETADFYRSEVHKQVESPEVWIVEALHKAAFKNTGLGQSLYAHDLSHISREGLQKYAKTHFTPDNMVVSAVGVDHDVLVGLTQEVRALLRVRVLVAELCSLSLVFLSGRGRVRNRRKEKRKEGGEREKRKGEKRGRASVHKLKNTRLPSRSCSTTCPRTTATTRPAPPSTSAAT